MTDRLPATEAGISRAAELLRRGEVVAFPTDTVYGVAVSWEHADRLPLVFELKRRPPEKRVAALVSDLAQAIETGWHADERAERLAGRFWPGPLTLVLPANDDPAAAATGEAPSQGFRAPDHAVALELIRAAGALFTTSANMSGEPDTLDADDVLVAFATSADRLAAIVDGGRVPGGSPSTVLDLTVSPARILRDGPLGPEDLAPFVDLG